VQQAARILTEAWKDPHWGTFLWLAMTVGSRRGELCALRREHVDLDEATVTIESSIYGTRARTRSKDTKSHQKRRIARLRDGDYLSEITLRDRMTR